MELNALRAALRGISAYREVTNTTVLGGIWMMLDALYQKNGEEALEEYVSRFYVLRSDGYEGLGDWLWDWLRYNETPYSRLIDQGKSDPALENAARRDIETLVLLAQTDCDRFIDAMKPLLPNEYAAALAGLRDKAVRFTRVVEKDHMVDAVRSLLE